METYKVGRKLFTKIITVNMIFICINMFKKQFQICIQRQNFYKFIRSIKEDKNDDNCVIDKSNRSKIHVKMV